MLPWQKWLSSFLSNLPHFTLLMLLKQEGELAAYGSVLALCHIPQHLVGVDWYNN